MEGLEHRTGKDKTDIMRHFDVVAEDIKHDFKGAFHDRAVQLR